MTYCRDHSVTYKNRLSELGIQGWKFYDSKSRYAREQQSTGSAPEFLQLASSGSFVPAPSFAATTGRKSRAKKDDQPSRMMSIELRTQNGTMMRIRGEFDAAFIKSVIQGV